MIMQLALKEKQAIAYAVADAFITQLQQLRQKVEKEREKNDNNRVDPAALRKIVSEAVAKVVEEKVARAVEEVRKEVQEVRREVQEKGGVPAAPAATTARARSWAAVATGETELPMKKIPGRLNREILVGLTTVDKVKFRIPTIAGVTRATALVTLTSQEEARKACEHGVVWRT
ncbi:hypothetical protein N657DRAFT_636633 [Parathielavia appendiculata]|uniref:Uncharacterized protein n=1 Tax=Parathielavia appendiculata TaxID=2587402 RepID=A0AAN6TUD0_9PEZI|nr:hypothetical protein N657DRAFT_636633 [Parathielavia appendiculata]